MCHSFFFLFFRSFFFFNDTATTEIYTLSLHDALPISPGLAPGRPPCRVMRMEERGRRLGEIPQRLLLDHLAACGQPVMLGAGSGELPTLLQVAGRALAARMPVRVLLDGQVPHVPGVSAVLPEHRLLGGRGEQP